MTDVSTASAAVIFRVKTLKMTAAEAVKTSVTTINSLSQDFTNLDDQPGFDLTHFLKYAMQKSTKTTKIALQVLYAYFSHMLHVCYAYSSHTLRILLVAYVVHILRAYSSHMLRIWYPYSSRMLCVFFTYARRILRIRHASSLYTICVFFAYVMHNPCVWYPYSLCMSCIFFAYSSYALCIILAYDMCILKGWFPVLHFFDLRICTECSEHVSLFIDVYWAHIRKHT